MSVYTKRISCPVCENLVNIPVYANVNSASMPREAADVASGLAFEKACPVCGNILRLDYAMFYWDPEMKVLLRYDRNLSAVPEEDILKDDTVRAFFEQAESTGNVCRCVSSLDELREKLLIFGRGLDDRVIEIMKALLVLDFQEHQQVAVDSLRLIEITDRLCFCVKTGGRNGAASFDMPAYNALKKKYTFSQSLYKVDAPWAFGVLKDSVA